MYRCDLDEVKSRGPSCVLQMGGRTKRLREDVELECPSCSRSRDLLCVDGRRAS